MHFEWARIAVLTPAFVARWRTLGLAASTPNIYLMPEFALPAIRHLEADKAPRVAALWNTDRSDLLALGIFNVIEPSWRFPFPRLSALRSIHSFQSGVLLREGIDAQAVDHFVDGLFGAPWRAVRLSELREDSVVYRQLRESAERRGLTWFVDSRYERAFLRLGDATRWRGHLSRNRRRTLRRGWKMLVSLGHVEFRVVQGADIADRDIETFLRLEGMGWKSKSALKATSENTQFFWEVMRAGRAQGLVVFCELLLNGTAIASLANFRVNGCGFAFKIGYDPAYAKVSPGFLVVYAFLESSGNAGLCLQEFDSGSKPGSFIESLWPDRVPMVSGHLVAGTLPTACVSLKHFIKKIRRAILGGAQ